MSWPAAGYTELGGGRFRIFCPHCRICDQVWDQAKDPAFPPRYECDSCEQTYVIPVAVSRGQPTMSL